MGRGERNHQPGQGRRREAGSEGSCGAKHGFDEQEPDRRPARWGNPAMDVGGPILTRTRALVNPADAVRRRHGLPWETCGLVGAIPTTSGVIRGTRRQESAEAIVPREREGPNPLLQGVAWKTRPVRSDRKGRVYRKRRPCAPAQTAMAEPDPLCSRSRKHRRRSTATSLGEWHKLV